MKNGLRIARIFGINIRVDWSWLLIFALVTWNLSSVFSQSHSDWGIWFATGIALVAAILFFSSVLVHELAHSLVAKPGGCLCATSSCFCLAAYPTSSASPPHRVPSS